MKAKRLRLTFEQRKAVERFLERRHGHACSVLSVRAAPGRLTVRYYDPLHRLAYTMSPDRNTRPRVLTDVIEKAEVDRLRAAPRT